MSAERYDFFYGDGQMDRQYWDRTRSQLLVQRVPIEVVEDLSATAMWKFEHEPDKFDLMLKLWNRMEREYPKRMPSNMRPFVEYFLPLIERHGVFILTMNIEAHLELFEAIHGGSNAPIS